MIEICHGSIFFASPFFVAHPIAPGAQRPSRGRLVGGPYIKLCRPYWYTYTAWVAASQRTLAPSICDT